MNESFSPESIVMAFIHAMNEWELSAWAASRQAHDTSNPESYWPDVTAGLEQVFAEFCTSRERLQGRQASFQRPPEYDPTSERIIASEIIGDKAHVDTIREAPLGGGLMSDQIGWRGLLRHLKDEAPQWGVLLPQLPRLVHRALSASAGHPLDATVIRLVRQQARLTRLLLMMSGLLAAVSFLLLMLWLR